MHLNGCTLSSQSIQRRLRQKQAGLDFLTVSGLAKVRFQGKIKRREWNVRQAEPTAAHHKPALRAVNRPAQG